MINYYQKYLNENSLIKTFKGKKKKKENINFDLELIKRIKNLNLNPPITIQDVEMFLKQLQQKLNTYLNSEY